MSRLAAYAKVAKQRVRWGQATRNARFFRGDDLRDYALNVANEYTRWVDAFFNTPREDVLDEIADRLMQLQAIQEELARRVVTPVGVV